MKNVAIILQDLRSGGSERFASRLSLLLCEKFNVYVLVFDASEKRFDCAGEFVDLGLARRQRHGKARGNYAETRRSYKKIRKRA